ncbi:MAG: hypothetical protein FWG99_05315 [Treponema sp.]|nr:hypothetical protein [Treponema sp.]
MADPELVQTLDYILNRSDENSIEVLAEAVVRRRRDISMFGALVNMPDPQQMAKEMTEKINTGIGATIETLKTSVWEMTARLIRQEAPDLSEEQVEELCRAWMPDPGNKSKAPKDLMFSMVEQFVSFSRGLMDKRIEKNLREELGAWPQRYWKIFTPAIRAIITDFLKDRITEEEYHSKIKMAMEVIQ